MKKDNENKRSTGRTTRLVDHYIQELFTKGEAIIIDHFNTRNENKELAKKVLNRLNNEHNKKGKVVINIFSEDTEEIKITIV